MKRLQWRGRIGEVWSEIGRITRALLRVLAEVVVLKELSDDYVEKKLDYRGWIEGFLVGAVGLLGYDEIS